ncbi:MAG: hypothetical protein AABY22_14015 [Nanoarchaeota archaeon]
MFKTPDQEESLEVDLMCPDCEHEWTEKLKVRLYKKDTEIEIEQEN